MYCILDNSNFLLFPDHDLYQRVPKHELLMIYCCCFTKRQNMNFILILCNLNLQIKPNMSYNPLCDFDESGGSSHRDITHRISQGGYGDSMRLYGSTPHFSALTSFHTIPRSTFSNRSNLNGAPCIVFFNYLIGHD